MDGRDDRNPGPESELISQFAPFQGTARFVVQRQLGSGAFGTVYQAWDRDQQVAVALKLLHSDNPDVLFRFKREFRALVDVRHSNLVQLFELVSEGTRWLLTMELVKGCDFLRYVRPDGARCDVDRLRHVLAQLAEGLRALHAAKLLHRDLKPANALITDGGRVVLLDFGLVRELDRPTSLATHSQIAGTPAYMAREVFFHGRVSDASDWYAVGVMLFEALTGALPHDRSPNRFWNDPTAAALDPRGVNAEAPEDLSELCVRLLSSEPEDRREAAATIPPPAAFDPGIGGGGASAKRRASGDHFVGRSEHLQLLDAAFGDMQEGRLNVVLVDGPSGIGKTALIERFVSLLEGRHADAIMLRGRCYEFESVPYKGLDALVDELSRHLQRLPEGRVEALLPRDAFLLPKLFPVLGRVAAIATAPARSAIVPDAQELRQRTFRALREVFERLSDRHPVVVWIDDLQWGDRDSSTFLAELCAPPQQPGLLLLLSYRNEDLVSNATLSYLHQVIANRQFPGNWHHLSIQPLDAEDSRQLLNVLLPPQLDTAAAHTKIIEEAGGHPLFLQQLASVTSARMSELTDGSPDGKGLELRQVLQDRVQQLPPLAREVLEFVCIAAQGLPPQVLFAAAENEHAEQRAETLALLIRERLARSAAVESGRRIEPAHDQVRTAVVELLTDDARRARHGRLAQVLASEPETEPQVLVTHYQEAGDHQAAFDASLRAASLAESQLAFDRAAVFYQVALASKDVDPVREAELSRKLAETLGLAGRGRDSAHAYLKAADCAEARDPFDLKRLAADQLMRSGFIDEALELFDQLAKAIGIPQVRSPEAAVRGIVIARARTRVQLMGGPPQPQRGPFAAADLEQLDLLRTGAVILNIADPVLATYFQTQHILKALRVREPGNLALALGVEASIRVAGGGGNLQAAQSLLKQGVELAEATGNPNALGMLYLLRAYFDYLLCRIPEGIRHSEQAIEFLSERCTGVAWEITAGYVLRFWFLCWAGYLEEVRNQLPRLLKDGAARGDVNMEVSLRLLSYVHYAYLSMDQPEHCIKECKEALSKWSRRGYHLQNYGATFSLVECHLYLGDYDAARSLLAADWERMSRSFILRWQTLQIMVLFLKGRAALACWLDWPQDQALRAEIQQCARKLARIRSHWTAPMAGVLDAGIAAGERRFDEASRQLEAAAEGFQNASLLAYAAAARHFAGVLSSGDRARILMKSAADFLQSQHVVQPPSFLRMLLPGRWTPEA